MVAPPLESSYGTLLVRSCSTIVLASSPESPENSGVYDGLDTQLVSATIPSTSTATPMRAIVRWAAEKPPMLFRSRANDATMGAGIRPASA